MATLDPAIAKEIDDFRKAYPSIEFVDAIFSDLCASVRGKRMDIASLEKIFAPGLRIPGGVHLLDVQGDSHNPLGHGFTDGDPDHCVFGVPGSIKPVPWSNGKLAQVMLSFANDDGSPYENEPRNVLKRVAERFQAETGLTPVSAFELEFYLLDQELDASGRLLPPKSPLTGQRDESTQVYAIHKMDAFAELIAEIDAAAKAQGVAAGSAFAEYAPGQFEINLHHVDDPVEAADQCILLKRIVSSVARKAGLRASFMAKPFLEQSGSGMHIHISAVDEAGVNGFSDGSRFGNDRLKHAIAGMMAVMPEAQAFFAPNPNSYRRFTPENFVPMRPCWGGENRAVAIRVPGGEETARRAEFRVPGADANPYLVMACLLAGMLHGIENQLDPGEMCDAETAGTHDGKIPLRAFDALRRLEQGEILPRYLGQHYCDLYRACKEAEYDAFVSEISSREYDWYLLADG